MAMDKVSRLCKVHNSGPASRDYQEWNNKQRRPN